MVNTSTPSGVSSSSGFGNSRFSGASGFGNSSLNTDSDSTSSSYSTRTDTTTLSGIEALSRESTTSERLLDRSTPLTQLADSGEINANSEQLLDTVPSGLSGTGQALAQRGYNIQVDNPVLSKVYESTISPWTGKGGFTNNAAARLQESGVNVELDVNQKPLGGLNRTTAEAQGISPGEAATKNGALAEQQIVDRYESQGLQVDTTAKFDANFYRIERAANQAGDRQIDIEVFRPHPTDPRLNEVTHIESKAFRVSNSDNDIKPNQLNHDVGMLENNRIVRGTGIALERTGRVLRPVGLVLDTVSVVGAIRNDGGIGEETGRTVTGITGGAAVGWAGASSGAAVGAAIGSAVPLVGTAAGAVVGGLIGGLGGAAAGEAIATKAFDTIKAWFD